MQLQEVEYQEKTCSLLQSFGFRIQVLKRQTDSRSPGFFPRGEYDFNDQKNLSDVERRKQYSIFLIFKKN